MNQFLNKWLSKTKELPYEIKIYGRGDLGFLRSFLVDGSLSIFDEKTSDGMGQILVNEAYQFICSEKIEDLLTKEERVEFEAGKIDFWLIDQHSRMIHLQRKTDYRPSTGVWNSFANVVYSGHVESTQSPE